MSLLTVPNQWGFEFHNWGGANAYPNTSCTGDAITLNANADIANATWVECASAAEISADIYQLEFGITNPSSSATDRNALLDLGIDEGNTGTFTAIISNIIVPATVQNFSYIFPRWVIPIRLKSGTRIGMRAATVDSSNQTGYAHIHAFGQPSRPDSLPPASQKFETLGYTSGVLGTAVSCQANPNGRTYSSTWTSIGTTTFRWTCLVPSMNVKSASVSFAHYFAEIGFGSSATSVTKICTIQGYCVTSEAFFLLLPNGIIPCDVPSGSGIYVRMLGDLTNPANQGNVHFTISGGG